MTDLKKILEERKAKKEKILSEYKDAEKKKPLTQGERLDRIEKLLGIGE